MSNGISYLQSLPLWDGRRSFSLDVPARLLSALENPQDRVRAVHVGGTNGKGTVCSYTAAMLHAAGARVGQMVSPHLTDVTERALINGVPAERAKFSAAIDEVAAVSRDLEISPSYFEVATVASFLLFAREELDWMVVEVGLGGRLDATNTMRQPAVVAITNVALDHTNVLGNTTAEIAREKAAIMRPGSPLLVGRVDPVARQVILESARDKGVTVQFYGEDFRLVGGDLQSTGWRESDWSLETPSGRFSFSGVMNRFNAKYQFENAALAVRIGQQLNLTDEVIRQGIASARWPGRAEWLQYDYSPASSVPVVIDVAHNPDGLSAFLEFLKEALDRDPTRTKIAFIVSILDRKDWSAMLKMFHRFEDEMSSRLAMEIIFTAAKDPRAVNPQTLAVEYGRGTVIGDGSEALSYALTTATASSLVAVTGSLFLVAELRPLLTDVPFGTISGAA